MKIFEEKRENVQLSLHEDGSVKGVFTDRTIVRLRKDFLWAKVLTSQGEMLTVSPQNAGSFQELNK